MREAGFTIEQLVEQQALFQQGLLLSTQQKWMKAEACFREAIAMGDCLPQPWGNLGICLAAQKRFDEAEDAYKRALEIDPNYKNANALLENLVHYRAHPDIEFKYKVSSPFDGGKTSMIFDER